MELPSPFELLNIYENFITPLTTARLVVVEETLKNPKAE
jgi:hypothetical protein